MQTRRRDQFSTVHTEGPILPPDLLRRVAENDRALGGLTPEAYHLSQGERLNEVINRSWNRLLGAWAAFRAATTTLGATDAATGLTRDRWLLPLFQELGYGRLPLARGIEVGGSHYPISHLWGAVPIHLVGAGVDLDRRAAGVAGAARVSPHGLVQDLLNRSDDHLWGFASNGLRLRVLRDNVSITRQSYVEWDLEAMMDGEVYADFALLWLVCHQSRVEGEHPDDCWLEKWTRAAQEQGTRALDQLRNGVEQAISALGRGFLAHPQNNALRAVLQAGPANGGLDTQDYYRQLLRLVYRLLFLFLFVAEDRDVLLDPNADQTARERYTSYYSTARLRRLADRRVGTRHHDLYQGLRLVMAKLGEAGAPALGLPALGGYLFSNEAVRDLAEREIANHDLLDAIRALAFVEDGRSRRLVDYRNLGAEELGSVYESLLELHPKIDADAATFSLTTASGNERKTTGSYYTPSSLIQCLLDSALDPILEEAAAKPDPEAAILDLKVCDPACGSGHFLIAASHRIAKRLAAIRTGEPEPSPEAVRTALRQVVGRCIYGVDLNPMAVELCKVSLWMEAVEPGKPLTFLDHHIQSGNSLLGTTPALLANGIPDEAFTPIEGDDKAFCSEFRKKNKAERAGQLALFDADMRPWEHIGSLATAMLALEDEDSDTIEGQRRKQAIYNAMMRSQDYVSGRILADAWCAAFVWKKVKSPELPYPITQERLREIERGWWRVKAEMRAEIGRLADQYRFFHWHLAFPDVFRAPRPTETPENEQAGWSGGFDVVLGNPPWDRLKVPDKEWFALRRPEIVSAASAAARDLAIERFADLDPPLFESYLIERRMALAHSAFARLLGRFPLCGHGEMNTFTLFAETFHSLITGPGRSGSVVPTGIATDAAASRYFQELIGSKTLVSLYDFENREGLFPAVDSRVKFCLLTTSGRLAPRVEGASFSFFLLNAGELREPDRIFSLTSGDISLVNPNSLTCPIFRGRRDADIVKAIYRRIPAMVNDHSLKDPWSINFVRMFDMSHDSKYLMPDPDSKTIPLYEGSMIGIFDHKAASYESSSKSYKSVAKDKLVPIVTQWYVPADVASSRVAKQGWPFKWFFGIRRIARNTDFRTLIGSILPNVGVSYSLYLVMPVVSAQTMTALASALTSFVIDYVCRTAMSQPSITVSVLKQLPILTPAAYGSKELAFIVPRVLELTYTAWDLEPFAKDVGYDGPPFRWDEDRRFLLRAELDALYFHLYGIERVDVEYIMETFPIVKRRDEQRHGKYRTREAILEIYDALAEAERTGAPYQTRLNPPPADIRVAHPNRDGTTYTGPGWQPPASDAIAPRPTVEPPAIATVGAPTPAATPAPARASAPTRQRTVTRLPSQPTLLDRDPLFAEVKAEPTSRPQSRPSQTRLPSQPPLLDRDPLFAEPVSDARPAQQPIPSSSTPPSAPTASETEDDEQVLRRRVLEGAIESLRSSGPLAARDLAQQLVWIDARIDRRLVNSVLHREGAATVRYDAARYTYTLRSSS